MKKAMTKLMIATAALVVVAGAASAQTLKATIPFEFRAVNRVMEPGTYRVQISLRGNTTIFDLSNLESGRSVVLLEQAPVEPQQAWQAEGQARLAFACTGGSCALAELWAGPGSHYAYTFHRPKLGKDETAVMREIPMQAGKGE